MGNVRRDTRQGKNQQIASQLRQGVVGMDAIPAGGRVYTQAELADFFDAHTASGQAVDHAYAAWRDAVQELRRMDALAKIVVQDLRNAVLARHGRKTDLLVALGIPAPKKAQLTVEQKQLAAARRLETRKLRRTMGRKQKLKIKAGAPAPVAAAAPTTDAPAESPNVGTPEGGVKTGGSGGDAGSE